MSLSKKNSDKLNSFLKNKNLIKDLNSKHIDKNFTSTKETSKVDDPNNIFYSLINNSDTLEETSKVNYLLRNSEKNNININTKRSNSSRYLTPEEELYDEFNYLLDE